MVNSWVRIGWGLVGLGASQFLAGCGGSHKIPMKDLFVQKPVATISSSGVVEINQDGLKWDADLVNLRPRSDGFVAVVAIEGRDGGKIAVLDVGAFRKPDGFLFHDAAMDIVTVRGNDATSQGTGFYEEQLQVVGSKYVFVSRDASNKAQVMVYDSVTQKGWSQTCCVDGEEGAIKSCEAPVPEPKSARLVALWKVFQERLCGPVFSAFADDLRYVSRGDGVRSIFGRDVRRREAVVQERKEVLVKAGVQLN